ncbi:pyridoxamine phosphate oxidase-like protein [Phlyctema vagabunda]|uniref:Pyridoxamine phosphate oxidase-like protein n=1 Tax=Phlyctema vagabunda TaxID=108571 RepID=A0ABR4PE41_9HELO
MPKFYETISDDLAQWAMSQPVFFTASAPLAGSHINISPKGLPSSTFTVLSPTQCAYIDATGSGSETIAHMYENGRCTIMFCSFGPSPRIMRFFCTGRVVEWDTPAFYPLLARMGKHKKVDGARAIILLDVWKVQTSCGYGVPKLKPSLASHEDEKEGEGEQDARMGFVDRDTLGHWAGSKVEKGEMQDYQREWNAQSLDALPGLRSARRDRGEWLWLTDGLARFRMIRSQRETLGVGILVGILLVRVVQVLLDVWRS